MPDSTLPLPAKPRRRKAKRPAPDPTVPRKPRVTFASRIEAMGDTYPEALRLISKGLPEFPELVRTALDASREVEDAQAHLDATQARLTAAQARLARAVSAQVAGGETLRRLDSMARRIADEWGALPATDDAKAPTVAPDSTAD